MFDVGEMEMDFVIGTEMIAPVFNTPFLWF